MTEKRNENECLDCGYKYTSPLNKDTCMECQQTGDKERYADKEYQVA